MKDKTYYEDKKKKLIEKLNRQEVSYLQSALVFAQEHSEMMQEVKELDDTLKEIDIPKEEISVTQPTA